MDVQSDDLCLPQLFEAQVGRTPQAVAIVCRGDTLTYDALNARANRLAHRLRALGVGPDVLVGLCVERSTDMVAALLAVLKAGGAYVPLDPTYPAERLAYMLGDARPAVVVTEAHLAALLPAHDAQTVLLDADATLLERESAGNPTAMAGPEHLAYVIYTSGSTGRPKGVEIPQRAVTTFLASMRHEPGLTAGDTLLAVTTLSFDIAVLELFLPLIVGARVVVAGRSVASDGAALADLLAASGATMMQATPATWRLLLHAGWSGTPRLTVLCGGEAMPRGLADQLLERCAALWNMYGPTETTVWSTLWRVEPGDGPILIGHPVARTETRVLDERLVPVPVGAVGELYIGGAGLARGYRNRPALTTERFIRHPFDATPGVRLYRTGDLARLRPDGTVECLGRVDHQVKVRGYRIELGEIEAVLVRQHGVREVAVAVREDVPGEKRLVAYVVSQPDIGQAGTAGSMPTPGELRRLLTTTLPDYMVPAVVVPLEALPLTPNGKVDRSALPPPPTGTEIEPAHGPGPLADLMTIHYQLIAIWEDLLGVRPIGIRDDFFALGGHSLLAARLVDRIVATFGVRPALATLSAEETIVALAEEILRLRRGEVGRRRPPLVTIQAGRSWTPFAFMHGDYTGGGFYCADLARLLGADRPFYAFNPHGLDGDPVPRSIEAMAASFLSALRGAQPAGSYLLGGFCAGGLVALEVARLLRAQGQEVDLLILINPPKGGARGRRAQRLFDLLGALAGLDADRRVNLYLRLQHSERDLLDLAHAGRAAQVEALRVAGRRVGARLAHLPGIGRRMGGANGRSAARARPQRRGPPVWVGHHGVRPAALRRTRRADLAARRGRHIRGPDARLAPRRAERGGACHARHAPGNGHTPRRGPGRPHPAVARRSATRGVGSNLCWLGPSSCFIARTGQVANAGVFRCSSQRLGIASNIEQQVV